jgi:spore germination protein
VLHRTTWFAIPIVGLVLVGTGLGWWGYDQYQERQTLAMETENQYNSTFHALVDTVHRLQQELGKTLISGDPGAFQGHLRDIWRLSYAAQSDVGRLPMELMPMHHTQAFLSSISEQAEQWMQDGVNPANRKVHKKLQQLYQEASEVNTGLASLQRRAFANELHWRLVDKALRKQERDNQVVDGFRKLDTAARAFVESEDTPSSLRRGKSWAMVKEKDVTEQQAKDAVRAFLNLPANVNLTVGRTKPGAYRPEYIVSGTIPDGDLTAYVSQDGGHVLSFDIRHTRGPGEFDFAEAQDKATAWLAAKGFPAMEAVQSSQYDSIAYFIFAPKRPDGSLVISQGTAVKIGLDNGDVIGYDANNYYYYPVRDVPKRNFTAAELRKKLNPAFQVGMERSVLALDEHQHYQPAVAFYGTANDETFCVYMNANTGKEMKIEQLT